MFAPVAFVWLVVAVWIQSAELKEQRTELQLTREEFKHQREVMEAQAAEARKQAEFIGIQTEILRETEEDRHTARNDAYLDEHIDNILLAIRDNKTGLVLNLAGEDQFDPQASQITSKPQLEGFGYRFAEHTRRYMDNHPKAQTTSFEAVSPLGFRRIHSAFLSAQEVSRNISSMARVRYQRYGVDIVVEQLERLAERTSFRDEPDEYYVSPKPL